VTIFASALITECATVSLIIGHRSASYRYGAESWPIIETPPMSGMQQSQVEQTGGKKRRQARHTGRTKHREARHNARTGRREARPTGRTGRREARGKSDKLYMKGNTTKQQ
jgi:hypothetical protein